jgi:Fe-S-cluster containining protein
MPSLVGVVSCSGDCCVAFPLSCSKDWLGSTRAQDGDLLAFMLREITVQEAADRRARFGVDKPVRDTGQQWFRCIYWDEETRLCGAYENRPAMCRDYPYPPTPRTCDKLGRPQEGAGVCEHGCDCQGAPLLWEGDN